jgi:hypothetical protein
MKPPKSWQQPLFGQQTQMQSSTKAPQHLYTNVHKDSDLSHEAVKKKEDGRRRKTKEDEEDDEDDDEGPSKWTWQTDIHP